MQLFDVWEQAGASLAAVEEGEFVAAGERRFNRRGSEETGAAEDQDLLFAGGRKQRAGGGEGGHEHSPGRGEAGAHHDI